MLHTYKTYENHTYKMHTRTTHHLCRSSTAQGTPLFRHTAPPVTQLSVLPALSPCAVRHAHPKPAKTTHNRTNSSVRTPLCHTHHRHRESTAASRTGIAHRSDSSCSARLTRPGVPRCPWNPHRPLHGNARAATTESRCIPIVLPGHAADTRRESRAKTSGIFRHQVPGHMTPSAMPVCPYYIKKVSN